MWDAMVGQHIGTNLSCWKPSFGRGMKEIQLMMLEVAGKQELLPDQRSCRGDICHTCAKGRPVLGVDRIAFLAEQVELSLWNYLERF